MANPNPSPKTRFGPNNPPPPPEKRLPALQQVKRIQDVLFKAVTAESVDNREKAALALAWERLEERKRIITMRPAPKPIDVSTRRKVREPASDVITSAGDPINAPVPPKAP